MLTHTHIAGAAALCAGAALLTGAPKSEALPILLVGAGMVGFLLRSRTRRWSILSAALHVAGGHRGPTHSLLCLAVAMGSGWFCREVVAWWALPLGVLSHLALDTLTWGGVPWLWPWKKHFRVRWALHTGSWVENAVAFPLLLITVAAEGLALLPGGGGH